MKPRKKSEELTSCESQEIKPRSAFKYAGGKKSLLGVLMPAAPKHYNHYYEPFVGGAALLFAQLPSKATISDNNPELINCYQVIRDDVELLMSDLASHVNEEAYFYQIRAMKPADMTPVARASRFIYLLKTCFNGLYRCNKSNQFNTSYGRYKNPKIVDKENLLAVSRYFQSSEIEIVCSDYKTVIDKAMPGDLIFLDPPYVPLTKTANFTSYTQHGFNLEHQKELAEKFAELSERGVKLMLTNSNTDVIHELYQDFKIKVVHAPRSINCKGDKRGKEANEVLVTNY